MAHVWELNGRPLVSFGYPIGAIAVWGFFGISGYLVTVSLRGASTARFLWHRALRILPGLWVVLAVTALFVAPLSVAIDGGDVASYDWADGVRYIATHAPVVFFGSDGISGTLAGSYSPVWNGSIWTLVYEGLCYLALVVAGAVGVLHRRWLVVALVVGLTAVNMAGVIPGGRHSVLNVNVGVAILFALPFACGVLLAVFSDRIGRSRWGAALAAAITVAGLFGTENPLPWVALPMTYLLLWVAGTPVLMVFVPRMDLSYGVYVYGFPVSRLVERSSLGDHGAWTVLLFVVPITVAFGVLSWTQVERRALRLKDVRSAPGWRRRSTDAAAQRS